MKNLIKKEIENLDSMIQNLEYELWEKKHTEQEKQFIDNLIEKYGHIRQELIEMED